MKGVGRLFTQAAGTSGLLHVLILVQQQLSQPATSGGLISGLWKRAGTEVHVGGVWAELISNLVVGSVIFLGVEYCRR